MRILVAALFLLPLPAVAADSHSNAPSLPIEVRNVPRGLEDVFGLSKADGALVLWTGYGEDQFGSMVSRDSIPTERIKVGDLILMIGGKQTPTAEALSDALSSKQPGDTVEVRLIRRDIEMNLRATVIQGPRPSYLPLSVCGKPTEGVMAGAFLAFGFAGMLAQEARGSCAFRADACERLLVSKQTGDFTRVTSLGEDFDITGDWRRHTHFDLASCLREKAALELKATPPMK